MCNVRSAQLPTSTLETTYMAGQRQWGEHLMMLPRWGEENWYPIPRVAYEKMRRGFLERHLWIHYIAHCTYCAIVGGLRGDYVRFTPRQWLEGALASS